MLLGYGIMVVATLGYLFISHLSPVFYLLRFVQGVSFAFAFTSAGTFVADYIPPERRAEGLGIFSAFTIASYAIGPSLGELVIELFGFYSFFIYASFFSLIAFVLTIFTRDGSFEPSSDPIIKPIFASSPPKSFIYRGRRKNEEKLQKKKKLATVARVKFLNCGAEKRDAIFFCRNQLNSA